MGALVLALAVPVGWAPVAEAASGPRGLGRPDLPEQRVSKVRALDGPGAKKARQKVAKDTEANAAQAARARAEQRGTWPGAGSATVRPAGRAAVTAKPGGLPVTLTPQAAGSQVRITVLDQKDTRRAGVTGVLLTARAQAPAKSRAGAPGAAKVAVDYSGFASAVGGGWAQRLRLVQLPACALTTPEKTRCRVRTALESDNDAAGQTVSADVPLGGAATRTSGTTVFAVTAADAGGEEAANGSGDYSATGLSESASWEAGGSSGAFTWSYGFTMPPAAAGPAPALSLSYDSGSIDGRTATTNNQGSAVGEGFSISESYIERSYGSCDDDGHTDVYDRCWKYDNARLVLNGKSNRLVKDGTSGRWRLENDDASTVTRSTGADNGDDNGEYWTVLTGDGSRYVFGENKLDGATTERTNSVWTVPVFGDDSGEPGYDKGTGFADRSLTQAWRWNLDHVEDTSGNASTYWYTTESNYYKKNKATNAGTSYIRGGYLKEIKYGLRKGALFTDDADAKVTLSHAERCTASDCTSLTKDTADNWPDVPFDAICSKDDSTCISAGPSFFSRKRLTGVNTYSWAAGTSTYTPVDSWALTQKYLDGGDIGDTSDHVLTLQSVKRTGKAGTDIAMTPVSFTYQMRPNRVDGTDDILPLTRPRISTVTSETGAITTVTLSAPECVRSAVLGAAQDSNTRNCYPQFWNINGAEEASVDWFHKYRVLAVTVSDPAGQNEGVEHAYAYSGAAWHHSDEPFTPKDERTWSDWRGYRQVTVYSGALDTTRSRSVSLYMQGMHGDKNKDGTTKSVTLAPLAAPAPDVPTITDSDAYQGQLREKVTYDGATAIAAEVHVPWSKETARQDVPDAGDHVARYVRETKSTAYTYLTGSRTWRARSTVTGYDDYGMPRTVEDRGDDARSGDESCEYTWYARDAGAGLTELASRTRVVAAPCATPDADLDLPADSSRRGDVVSDTATAYDGQAWSSTMKPIDGLVTWTGRAKGYDTNGAPVWQKISGTRYDALGRPVSMSDATGEATTTAYTPATAGPLTKTVTTDPKAFTGTSFLDARRGQPLRSYDANLRKTELTYDSLGRLTAVWLPNRNRAAGYGASQKFTYHLDNVKQSWVSTAKLKKDGTTYSTSYTIYDALLRPLQNQTPSARGGRLLTDTRYDSRGLAHENLQDIFDDSTAPNGTYTRAEYGEAPKQTETVHDGAGRATSSTLYVFGEKKWSTSTAYTGDSTATTAVQGGSATRAITDARGRTVETREYAGTQPADTEYGGALGVGHASTEFAFTVDGKQSRITGPDGATWTYGYDLFGRETTTGDPDKGTSSTAYDVLDRPVKVTDSRGRSVLTGYDELGRVTGTWAGSVADATQLTGYTYDTVLKGQQATATRYVGGKAGRAYTKSVTGFDSMSRPVASTVRLPADDPLVVAGVPATLEYSSYFNIDGSLQNTTEPALGGLPSEIIDYGYDDLGQVTSIGGATGYLLGVDYSALGQAQQLILGTANTEAAKKSYVTNTFEEGTGRLTRSHVTDQTHPYMLQDLNYTFDQSGNVTAITDPTTLGGAGKAETQCFGYDGHSRLTEAWTPQSQKCADTRSASALSGPAPYWTSYTYNTAGQRTGETQHRTTGDTTTTYCYEDDRPHALAGTSTSADCASPERSYGYDATGNTTERPGKTGAQALSWSDAGQLAELTENGKSTDYLYDAEGNLLVRATEGGERILYAGATEVHLRSDGTTWAQRSYASGPMNVAVRSNQSGSQKVTYLAGDHHNTQSLAVSGETSQVFSKRYTGVFGAPRGAVTGAAWPDDKGFLGRTTDTTTGLTHVGARQYDPSVGQFLSVDPKLSLDQAQSLNGYSYANNNPVTHADPTGEAVPECLQGLIKCQGGIPVSSGGGKKDTGSSGSSGSGSSGNSGSGSTAGSGGGGGCDSACLRALNNIAKKWKGGLYKALGTELKKYVMVLGENVSPCSEGAMVSSGVAAGCDDLAGIGSTDDWNDLLNEWLNGKGGNRAFGAGSVMTQQLAANKHSLNILEQLQKQISAADYDIDPASLGGKSSYKDGKNWSNVWNDVQGMLTDGAKGSGVPEAFMGSYDQAHQVINVNKRERTFTVAFAAYNETGTESLTHVVPDIGQGKQMGTLHQTYYWTITVGG